MAKEVAVLLLLVATFSVIECMINTANHWSFGGLDSNSRCEYIFHQSVNEKVRKDHSDPLFIWMGRPSSAIQTMICRKISGRIGMKTVPLPVPSLWISFVNILYVTKCFDIAEDEELTDSSTSYKARATPIQGSSTKYLNSFDSFLSKDWLNQPNNISKYFRFVGTSSEESGKATTCRSLYVGGNLADQVGGRYTLEVAEKLIEMLTSSNYLNSSSGCLSFRGVLIGDAPGDRVNPYNSSGVHLHYRPAAQFVPFKSFESIPGHVGSLANPNVYKLDRIAQPVVCNALFAQVDFRLHDLHLSYAFVTTEAEGTSTPEMHEYRLASISTFKRCYLSVEEWKSDPDEELWYNTPGDNVHGKVEIYPVLPRSAGSGSEQPFPQCEDSAAKKPSSQYDTDKFRQARTIQALLGHGLTVFAYSTIHNSPRPICSFYIGIYESDALQWPDTDTVVRHTLAHFDSGTLVDVVDDVAKISTVCDQDECSEISGVDMAVIGQIQDAGANNRGGRLIWGHFDSKSGRLSKEDHSVFVSVSKHTAVDILRRLVRGNDDINYVDIYE